MSGSTGSARLDQIAAAARGLLEEEGDAGLSMRRVAERVGIRAPSLYKHVPDKAALEVMLIADGLAESAEAMATTGGSLAEIARVYREWALAHPHLYGLMTAGPLPRDRLPEGLEDRAASPILAAFDGDEDRARAAWAAAHGLAALELADRFPADADLDAAWAAMVAAFSP